MYRNGHLSSQLSSFYVPTSPDYEVPAAQLVVTTQFFVLYIRLLDRRERHPSVENPDHFEHALIEV
jgi:hypothetical protein